MKKVCFILNYAPHYREEIFQLIDREFECDFYFGNKTFTNIKKLDYNYLKGFKKELDFKKIFKNFYFLKGQIILALKEYNTYIITGQPYNISSWFLLIINRLLGKRTYIWNHGIYGDEDCLALLLKKSQFNLSNGYLLYGNYARKLMLERGFKKEKLHVIYNSLHYNQQLEIRKQLVLENVYKEHFKNNNPVIVFIGRVTKAKKLQLLIEAVKLLSNDNNLFNLVIIGDGEEKEDLIRLASKLKMSSQTWFYGSLYDEDKIAELLYNAQICVSPGNVGLTAIHAMSYGCPVFSHNTFSKQGPEFEAIKEGLTGKFFNENDINSLKDAIHDWHKKYPEKNNNVINACYNIIDTYYNPNVQIDLLKDILK